MTGDDVESDDDGDKLVKDDSHLHSLIYWTDMR